MKKLLSINVVSESVYGSEGQGVHTAFVDTVEMLKRRSDVTVKVNSFDRCDVMHAHTFGPLYWAIAPRYRHRRVMSAHVVPDSVAGSLVGWRLWQGLFTRYIRFAYNSVSTVVAVAPAVRRTLKEIGVRTRMEVITNPVDLKRFKPDAKLRREGRELLGLKPAQKVALCVGQIQPRKGVAEFVAAGRANPGITFVWVGGRPFGKLTDAYKGMNELMEEAPKNVHFAGMFALDRMPSLYNAADMLYFPSVQENCALAITEAAACGLPLLLRELDDYHELYGDSFFSAKDTPSFALAVKQAFASRAKMAAMRRKSLAMAKRFDVGVLVEKLVGVYRQLAEEAGPR